MVGRYQANKRTLTFEGSNSIAFAASAIAKPYASTFILAYADLDLA